MPNYTSNYNLKKPITTENFNIDDTNGNMDIIDTQLKNISDKTHVFRLPHTYAIPGAVKVASGDIDYIIPFFVSLATGQTAKLVKVRYRINSGTSVTVKVTKNNIDVVGLTGISVTPTTSESTVDISLADNDSLALIVTGISGSPKNMTFTFFIEYEQ